MAANKRTDFEIEHHRREIARLYLHRHPQHVIAGALGIPRSIVAYDLGVIQKRWRDETTIDLDARKAEELARLDALEREYWRAWEASHDPWEEPAPPEAYDGELALKRAQKAAAGRGKGAHRTGFSGYLEGVERCIEQRCKLLGLSTQMQPVLVDAATTIRVEYAETESQQVLEPSTMTEPDMLLLAAE